MDKRKDKIMIELEKFTRKVKKILNVERFVLFGSRARGDNRGESDIDLVIISKDFEGIKYFKRSPELYLLWKYPDGVEIDIVCLTPDEFSRKAKQISIMREASREGIEL